MDILGPLVRPLAALQPPPPGQTMLRDVRRRALESVLADYRPRAGALEPGLAAGDEAARDRLASLATEALTVFRDRVFREARMHPVLHAAAALDRAWNGPTPPEHMDDPDFDEGERTRIIRALDDFNVLVGSYATFLEALAPLFVPGGTTKVLDLASGHGGFPLALARLAKERGLDLAITATDLQDAYLDVGAARARAEGLAVSFRRQDALDLSNLAGDPPDVVVCTQAIHHFPPGLVTCMFDQAARVARRGVVFVDGCRNVLHTTTVATYGLAIAGVPGFTHDAVISLRRFFAIEELDLLVNLVPRATRAEASFLRPAHLRVRWSRT
ncbi:MAG: methyltransferase domain-containing protein [Polyangiales bacterium]